MPFALPEYEDAFVGFLFAVVNDVARAGDPVLSQIAVESQTSTVASRLQSRDGIDLDLPERTAGFQATATFDAVRSADFDEFAVDVQKAAEQMREDMSKGLFENLDRITTATGNVVDAKGRKLTFELVYEMLDSMEWSLSDDGELSVPSLIMNPADVERLKALETPETAAAMDELKQRKYEELIARRPRRRLS
jgi:hypothetical protein